MSVCVVQAREVSRDMDTKKNYIQCSESWVGRNLTTKKTGPEVIRMLLVLMVNIFYIRQHWLIVLYYQLYKRSNWQRLNFDPTRFYNNFDRVYPVR